MNRKEVNDKLFDTIDTLKMLKTYFEEMIEVCESPGTLQTLTSYFNLINACIERNK